MNVALKLPKQWTADEFVITDQAVFGNAWRYELVEGRIIAHDAPGGAWIFEAVGGADAVLRVESLRIEIPLSEIYVVADIAQFDSVPPPA